MTPLDAARAGVSKKSMRAFPWIAVLGVLFSSCVVRGPVCPAGQTNCGDYCADLYYDDLDCGACGAACRVGDFCSQGYCVVGTCVGDGYGCRFDTDCCSNYCASDGRCGCIPAGNYGCSANLDCCSNYCGRDGLCR